MKTRTLMIWLVSALTALGAAGLVGLDKYADWDYQRTCVEQGRDSSACRTNPRASWAGKRCDAGDFPPGFFDRPERPGNHQACITHWLDHGKP